jgi:hypothetical protein
MNLVEAWRKGDFATAFPKMNEGPSDAGLPELANPGTSQGVLDREPDGARLPRRSVIDPVGSFEYGVDGPRPPGRLEESGRVLIQVAPGQTPDWGGESSSTQPLALLVS